MSENPGKKTVYIDNPIVKGICSFVQGSFGVAGTAVAAAAAL